jgi:hypothetical protein
MVICRLFIELINIDHYNLQSTFRCRFFRHQHIFFFVLKAKNANKVGFRIKKYLRHLKTFVSVSVSDFPRPKTVVSGVGVGVGKTDTKKCWCRGVEPVWPYYVVDYMREQTVQNILKVPVYV